MTQCDLPPKGWICYLEDGHAGPCPTYATRWTEIKLWFRDVRLARYFREARIDRARLLRVCDNGHQDCWGPNVPGRFGGCK